MPFYSNYVDDHGGVVIAFVSFIEERLGLGLEDSKTVDPLILPRVKKFEVKIDEGLLDT